jgi:hypothetical protein
MNLIDGGLEAQTPTSPSTQANTIPAVPTDWISVHGGSLRIPSNWTYEDIGLRGAFIVYHPDATLDMQVEYLREGDFEEIINEVPGYLHDDFIFDDGSVGYMLQGDNVLIWFNMSSDRWISLYFGGNWPLIEDNWETIATVVSSLR